MKDLSKKSLLIGLLLESFVVLYSYFECSGNITYFFQTSARLSGRVSLLFFSLLFLYHTLQPDLKEKKVLDSKYNLSFNFAIIHIIHWFFLAVSVYINNFNLVPTRVIAGAIAYLIIIVLPFAIKRKILQKVALNKILNVYLFYVWFIFFMTYLSRLTSKDNHFSGSKSTYIVLIIFTIGLMLWRLIIQIKKSNK